MNFTKLNFFIVFFLIINVLLISESIWIKGYYKSDGTYVSGHYRSSPDKFKWNNYGPSQSSSELINYYERDYDSDGQPNTFDLDDDNDFIFDDLDSNQYSPDNFNYDYDIINNVDFDVDTDTNSDIDIDNDINIDSDFNYELDLDINEYLDIDTNYNIDLN